MYKLEVGT
jgi:hypothetical protein